MNDQFGNIILHPENGGKRWALVGRPISQDEAIVDLIDGKNLCFLASGMMGGANSDVIALAKRVVDFLNSLPDEETRTYPHKATARKP